MESNVERLTTKVAELQRQDGLRALHVYRNGDNTATQEEIAGGILNLMESEIVSDPDTF